MNSPCHKQMWLQIKAKCVKQVNQLGKTGFKNLDKNRRKKRKMKTKIHAVTCQIFIQMLLIYELYTPLMYIG